VEDRRGHSHFCVARSANGVDDWQIDPQPTLLADPEYFPEEVWGIEGSRITYLMRDGTSQSPSRPRSRRKLAVSGSACTALGRPASALMLRGVQHQCSHIWLYGAMRLLLRPSAPCLPRTTRLRFALRGAQRMNSAPRLL
jgi:hypothetical protein